MRRRADSRTQCQNPPPLIGKAKVTATARGALANEADIQANLDKALAWLRDGVVKIRAIPQLSVSVDYSF